MRLSLIFSVLALLAAGTVLAQNVKEEVPYCCNLNPALDSISVMEDRLKLAEADQTRRNFERKKNTQQPVQYLMTPVGLNVLAARKFNSYLTGTADLSLNKTYFILDPVDGRLFLGINWGKDPSKRRDRIKSLLTTGIQADATDGFATLFTKGDKWSPNIGVSGKFTIFGKASIKYSTGKRSVQYLADSAQQQVLKKDTVPAALIARLLREEVKMQVLEQLRQDSADFDKTMSAWDKLRPSPLELAWMNKKKETFYEEKYADVLSDFYKKEADIIEEEEVYNVFSGHYFSFIAYIPVTSMKYTVTQEIKSELKEEKLWNMQLSILYSYYREKRKSRWVLNGTVGLNNQNNILTSDLDTYNRASYNIISINPDTTVTLSSKDPDKVYVGNYKRYLSPYISTQGVAFLVFKKSLGLSLQIDQYLQHDGPSNIKVGIPFNLKGKDEDTKASFEVSAKWNDIFGKLSSSVDRFVVGISIGVPLAGKLY
ncbi:hypothetical protein CLV59_11254 [Chitinophaga dinghuensis]|uniref:DUF5723 domain-containing protein n=1 Tax=Chitinophaga dinghuensis TaxID=1539050 RepID=A0A327VSZ0_9BACT|nr:hypothetical protein [Chitinophaga dinghuensis]RAJ73713.1 hypothetical protein CLV59_11254 [Chitinophaga dinghuensis]